MKILHTSDWHVGRRLRGRSRQEEHEAVLDEIVGLAEEHDVDLVLVAGDLFDVSVPPAWAEELVYSTLVRLSRRAEVVVIAGNHDHPGRLRAVTPLLALGGVHVGSTVAPPGRGGVVDLDAVGARVALLPWQSQRGIVGADELMAGDADEHSQTYADRMRRIVAALCDDLPDDRVNVVVAHVTAHGADPSGSERDVHSVRDYSIPAGVFPSDLSYVALGHFHRRQSVPAGVPVWYSGSPLQLDFGEVGDEKGVLLVEARPGFPAKVTPLPIAAGRRLVRLRGTLEQIEAAAASAGDAHVRVELDEPGRAGLADEVRRMIPGAVDVLLLRRDLPERGTPERRLGRPRREVFAEYLSERGVEDERIVALFSELLDAVS